MSKKNERRGKCEACHGTGLATRPMIAAVMEMIDSALRGPGYRLPVEINSWESLDEVESTAFVLTLDDGSRFRIEVSEER